MLLGHTLVIANSSSKFCIHDSCSSFSTNQQNHTEFILRSFADDRRRESVLRYSGNGDGYDVSTHEDPCRHKHTSEVRESRQTPEPPREGPLYTPQVVVIHTAFADILEQLQQVTSLPYVWRHVRLSFHRVTSLRYLFVMPFLLLSPTGDVTEIFVCDVIFALDSIMWRHCDICVGCQCLLLSPPSDVTVRFVCDVIIATDVSMWFSCDVMLSQLL